MVDTIRLGLVGASVGGTWSARSHLPAVQATPTVELAAVCTTKAESAEAARQAYGARLAFDDYRKMVSSPEIDAVAVVVRVPSHYAPTKAMAGTQSWCSTRACWWMPTPPAYIATQSIVGRFGSLENCLVFSAAMSNALRRRRKAVEWQRQAHVGQSGICISYILWL